MHPNSPPADFQKLTNALNPPSHENRAKLQTNLQTKTSVKSNTNPAIILYKSATPASSRTILIHQQ